MVNSGLTSLKNKAVNMNRGPRGIEPYVQYMEPGGAVGQEPGEKGYVDKLINYFGYGNEPEVLPVDGSRNVPEEQYRIAQKARLQPGVEEGIQRAKVGRYTDERTSDWRADGPVMSGLISRFEQNHPLTLNPFEKNEVVMRDDPYAKPQEPPQEYKSGIEFGDIESGFDLLNQTKFNPALLAGLRDNRTLSDYVKVHKRDDKESSASLRNADAFYQGRRNTIQMKPIDTYFGYDFNANLAHELMHKGAFLLSKNSDAELMDLRDSLYNRKTRGQADHRYIQSIVNKAYVDRMIVNGNSDILKDIAETKADIKNDGLKTMKDFYTEDLARLEKKLISNTNSTLVGEARRVFDLYLTKDNKKSLKQKTQLISDKYGFDFFDTFDDDGYEKYFKMLKDMPFEDAMGIFNAANSVMAEDYLTQALKKQYEGAETSLLTSDYASNFPNQIPAGADRYTEKAKGGVIGLKDRAVNMHRNVL